MISCQGAKLEGSPSAALGFSAFPRLSSPSSSFSLLYRNLRCGLFVAVVWCCLCLSLIDYLSAGVTFTAWCSKTWVLNSIQLLRMRQSRSWRPVVSPATLMATARVVFLTACREGISSQNEWINRAEELVCLARPLSLYHMLKSSERRPIGFWNSVVSGRWLKDVCRMPHAYTRTHVCFPVGICMYTCIEYTCTRVCGILAYIYVNVYNRHACVSGKILPAV